MHTPVRAVLFDLDGTLLDTLTDLAVSMNEALDRFGCPVHSVDDYRSMIGDGVYMLAARALPPGMRSPESIQDCVQTFRAVYARRWQETTKPYPGVEEMLSTLAADKIALAVVTNKPHAAAVECIQAFFPRIPFVAVVGQSDEVPPKPDPAGAHLALDRCRTDPARSLYVGDSGVDMQTARRAGLGAVGVLWGFRSRDELMAEGAGYLAVDAGDIVKVAGGVGPGAGSFS